MGHVGARQDFQTAKSKSEDEGVRALAEGLIKLSRAMEDDVRDLKCDIESVRSRVNSIR
jgi:hypothetical protein